MPDWCSSAYNLAASHSRLYYGWLSSILHDRMRRLIQRLKLSMSITDGSPSSYTAENALRNVLLYTMTKVDFEKGRDLKKIHARCYHINAWICFTLQQEFISARCRSHFRAATRLASDNSYNLQRVSVSELNTCSFRHAWCLRCVSVMKKQMWVIWCKWVTFVERVLINLLPYME